MAMPSLSLPTDPCTYGVTKDPIWHKVRKIRSLVSFLLFFLLSATFICLLLLPPPGRPWSRSFLLRACPLPRPAWLPRFRDSKSAPSQGAAAILPTLGVLDLLALRLLHLLPSLRMRRARRMQREISL